MLQSLLFGLTPLETSLTHVSQFLLVHVSKVLLFLPGLQCLIVTLEACWDLTVAMSCFFSLFSVYFIAVNLWQFSRGLIKLWQSLLIFLVFFHHFHWCHSIIELALVFKMFKLFSITLICPFKPTHVYFWSVIAYFLDSQFSYLYDRTTSLSGF